MKKRNAKVLFVLVALCALSVFAVFLISACADEETHIHEWGEWHTVVAPACTADGKEQRECLSCGKSEERAIDATGHKLKDAYGYDGNSHWKECEVCREKAEIAPHKLGTDNSCEICDYAMSVSEGLSYEKSPDGGSYTVTGAGSFAGKELAIPMYHEGLPVTSIADRAFYGEKFKSVTLYDTVEYVGAYAFGGCLSLTEAELGNSLEYIGDYAFDDCFGLMSVKIGGNPDYIGQYAFRDCYRLVEVIDNSDLGITVGSRDNGYVGFHALGVIEDGEQSRLTNIGDYVFYDGETPYLIGYTGTEKTLTLPASFDGKNYRINSYAFYGGDLTAVDFGGAVGIGNDAFGKCANLSAIDLDGITYIGESAFGHCSSLVDVKFGSELNEIGKYAFESCGALSEIYIPENVSVINDYVFDGCDALTSINCGSESKPDGWTEYWNWYSDAVINWGMAPDGGN